MELTHSASHLLTCTASFVLYVFKENIFHLFVWVSMRVHEKMTNKTNPKLNSEIKIWKWVQFGASEPENTLILLPVCSAFCWTSFDYQEQKEEKKVFPVSDKLSKVQTFPLIVAGKRPLSAEAHLADALRSTFSCRQKDWVTSALRVNTCAICPSRRFTRVFNMMRDDRFIFSPATASENSEIEPKLQELCERASETCYLLNSKCWK